MDFTRQLMPAPIFNQVLRLAGIRMAWMKSHVCPCTMSSEIPGSPSPSCNTCHGRGRYWDQPIGPYVLLRTFMHTSEAADEPGVVMDPRIGQVLHAEPTITIGSDVQPLWDDASEYDAYVELDTLQRYETAMIVGGHNVVPYQWNMTMLGVRSYDVATRTTTDVDPANWTNTNGQITVTGLPEGTAFTVAYKANPVYVAWRRAGGNMHARPFGAGLDALPRRFRCQLLDVWTRSRNINGVSTSPQAVF